MHYFIKLFFFCLAFLVSFLPAPAAVLHKPAKDYSVREVQKIWEEASPNYKVSSSSPRKKKGAMFPTVAQFSGAYDWAHRKGITGKGQTAIVLEGNGNSLFFVKKETTSEDPSLQKDEVGGDEDSHARFVAHVLHQIAPNSIIIKRDHTLYTAHRSVSEIKGPFKKWMEQAFVINLSQGIRIDQYLSKSLPNYHASYEEWVHEINEKESVRLVKLCTEIGIPKLLFKSAGNDSIDLSRGVSVKGRSFQSQSLVLLQNPLLQPYLIIVGALDERFNPATFSNYPGQDTLIQENFLCTLGQSRGMIKGVYELRHGTSFSAPTAAGAALLIRQKFPRLSAPEIKEVLLESASKTFLIEEKNGYLFVYDPEEEEPDVSQISKFHNVHIQKFAPYFYGKGVLDLRAALTYAQLLSDDLDHVKRSKKWWKKTETSRLSSKELRAQMKIILHHQEIEAANTIKKWYQERKKETKES